MSTKFVPIDPMYSQMPTRSGGASPDAEYSPMSIVLRTSASSSCSALPGSWK